MRFTTRGLRRSAVIGALACASTVAACGSGAAGGPAAASAPGIQHVTITGTNALRFTPMTVRVRTGTVRVTLAEMGAYPHNLVIPALHVTSATVTGDPGSGTASVTVRFPRPGRYAFQCQYHASAGMTGVFLVS